MKIHSFISNPTHPTLAGSSTSLVTVTGVGFTPSCLLVHAGRSGGPSPPLGDGDNQANMGFWVCTGPGTTQQYGIHNVTVNSFLGLTGNTSCSIESKSYRRDYWNSATSWQKVSAQVTGFDSNGFTLQFNKEGDNSGAPNNYTDDIVGLVLGGPGLTVNVITGRWKTSVGSQSFTGMTFKPDAVLFLSGGSALGSGGSPLPAVSNTFSQLSFGCADKNLNQFAVVTRCSTPVTSPNNAFHAQDDTHCLLSLGAGVIEATAKLISMDSDGFTLNFDDAAPSDGWFIALGLQGEYMEVGQTNILNNGVAGLSQTGMLFRAYLTTDSALPQAQTSVAENGYWHITHGRADVLFSDKGYSSFILKNGGDNRIMERSGKVGPFRRRTSSTYDVILDGFGFFGTPYDTYLMNYALGNMTDNLCQIFYLLFGDSVLRTVTETLPVVRQVNDLRSQALYGVYEADPYQDEHISTNVQDIRVSEYIIWNNNQLYECTFSVPLKMDIDHGQTIRILDENDDELFYGIVESFSHDLDLNTATLVTTITLTSTGYVFDSVAANADDVPDLRG